MAAKVLLTRASARLRKFLVCLASYVLLAVPLSFFALEVPRAIQDWQGAVASSTLIPLDILQHRWSYLCSRRRRVPEQERLLSSTPSWSCSFARGAFALPLADSYPQNGALSFRQAASVFLSSPEEQRTHSSSHSGAAAPQVATKHYGDSGWPRFQAEAPLANRERPQGWRPYLASEPMNRIPTTATERLILQGDDVDEVQELSRPSRAAGGSNNIHSLRLLLDDPPQQPVKAGVVAQPTRETKRTVLHELQPDIVCYFQGLEYHAVAVVSTICGSFLIVCSLVYLAGTNCWYSIPKRAPPAV